MDNISTDSNSILDLQKKVVLLRHEVPIIYEDLLKKQGKISADNLTKHTTINFQAKLITMPEDLKLIEKLEMHKVRQKRNINIKEIKKVAEDIRKCHKLIGDDNA